MLSVREDTAATLNSATSIGFESRSVPQSWPTQPSARVEAQTWLYLSPSDITSLAIVDQYSSSAHHWYHCYGFYALYVLIERSGAGISWADPSQDWVIDTRISTRPLCRNSNRLRLSALRHASDCVSAESESWQCLRSCHEQRPVGVGLPDLKSCAVRGC